MHLSFVFFISFFISFVSFFFSSTSSCPLQDIIPRLAWNIQHEELAHLLWLTIILLAILSERLSWKLA